MPTQLSVHLTDRQLRIPAAVARLAIRGLGPPACLGVEELESEASGGLVRGARSYDPSQGALDTWLYGQALFAVRSVIARQRRREARMPACRPLHDVLLGRLADRRGPSGLSLEDRELIALILRQLRASERELVRLYYWEGRSQREIAGALGLTRNTVAERLRACLARLRRRLGIEKGSGA